MSNSRQLPVRLVWAAWTVPALLSTFETLMFMGGRVEPWRAFVSEAPGWYTWALLTPVIAMLAERFPLKRPIAWRAVLAHVGGWLVVATCAAFAWSVASMLFRNQNASFLQTARSWFLSGLPFTVLGYSAVVGICYMVSNRELAREREQQAAQLAQQLSEAQLVALRAQLQPHFLFNSLNAIMALVRDTDSVRAVAALTTLSTMLRASLQHGNAAEIALSREVAFTRDYLDLERLRFADRLSVTFEIPPNLLDACVPTFVLQPFVENAIKHGLMDSRVGIAIEIVAHVEDESLVLTVSDDGAGFANSTVSSQKRSGNTSNEIRTVERAVASTPANTTGGTGIENAQKRLTTMYGNRASLQLTGRAEQRGTSVQVRIPLRRAPLATT